jgi:hypothetical protein
MEAVKMEVCLLFSVNLGKVEMEMEEVGMEVWPSLQTLGSCPHCP